MVGTRVGHTAAWASDGAIAVSVADDAELEMCIPDPRARGEAVDYELTVVVPVHNESVGLKDMLTRWSEELDRLGISHVLRVYDDGSNDGTPEILTQLMQEMARLEVVRQPNAGHGPTILRGYREAESDWILQVDGDDEVGAGEFSLLWSRRNSHDLLLGIRQGRNSPAVRRLITRCARWAVRAIFGVALRDANTPFRLMRRDTFLELLALLPGECFAPNAALAGMAGAWGRRVVEVPVSCRPRASTATSLRGLGLWRGVVRSAWQMTVVGMRFRGLRRRNDGGGAR